MPASNSLINLLVSITRHALDAQLIPSALFYAERLQALIPSSELAVWLLSLCLLRSTQPHAAVHLLRNTPVFTPSQNSKSNRDDPFQSQSPSTHLPSSSSDRSKSSQLPACSASSRCALVYSQACSSINRPKEGLQVYLKAIDQFGIPSAAEIGLLQPSSSLDQSRSSTYTHLASLSYKSHEYEKANKFYRKALDPSSDGHLCWEAFEGLCQTIDIDDKVDPNQIFSSVDPNQYLSGYMDLDDNYILCTPNASTRQSTSSVPITSNAPIKFNPPPLAPKDAFRIMGTNALHLHKQHQFADSSFGESSHNSSYVVNSFDRPPYLPSKQHQPPPHQSKSTIPSNHRSQPGMVSTPNLNQPSRLPPRSFNFAPIAQSPQPHSGFDPHPPISSTPNLRHGFQLGNNHHHFSPSSHHPPPPMPMPAPSPLPSFNTFSPNDPTNQIPSSDHHLRRSPSSSSTHAQPTTSTQAQTRGALGGSIKRTRSQTQSQDLSRCSGDPVPPSPSTDPQAGQSTNTQNTGDHPSSKVTPQVGGVNGAHHPNGKPSLMSSSYPTEGCEKWFLKMGPRSTKRVKSKRNMADLPSSSGLDPRPTSKTLDHDLPFRPPSLSASRRDKLDAIAWLKNVLTSFATAYLALARFDSPAVLDAVNSLPHEQKKSCRAFCLVGRAKFEMLDYKSAEIAFRKARESFPHLVQYMDIYSTLLWHLRKTTELSYLSQELQLIDGGAAETWIATGNLFSRIDDHPNALRCFQRATQLSPTGSYGFTLSGHECLILEEYSRSLIFFRESIRRNSKLNYNGFFGLGECYFKQDRFRLAIFFFNQAFKINPSNPLILASLAKVFEALGYLTKALDVYNHALRVASSDVASVRFSRAKVLFSLGQFEPSRDDLVKLVELVPTEFNIRFLLGKISIQLGDHDQAIKHLTYAVDLEPNSLNRIKKILLDAGLAHLHRALRPTNTSPNPPLIN